MANMSNFLENALYDHILRNVEFTSPTNLEIALYSACTDDSQTEIITEGTGGYARQTIAFNAPSNGVGTNTAEITWGPATQNWATATHFGIIDSGTDDLLIWGAFAASETVFSGYSKTLAAGGLTVSFK